MKQTINTKRLTMMAIATAILLIQNFVPFLGNLPLPPLNPTIIHITVIVFTFLLGTRDGMIIGAIWGIIRIIRAFAMPASPLDPLIWTNPMIAVLPRLLIGLTVGVTYQWLRKKWPDARSLRSCLFRLVNQYSICDVIYLCFLYRRYCLLDEYSDGQYCLWIISYCCDIRYSRSDYCCDYCTNCR